MYTVQVILLEYYVGTRTALPSSALCLLYVAEVVPPSAQPRERRGVPYRELFDCRGPAQLAQYSYRRRIYVVNQNKGSPNPRVVQ